MNAPSDPGTGLADPVLGGQGIFRALLDAMARPGTVHRPAGLPDDAGSHAALTGVALMLLDQETPVWLDAGGSDLRARLAFHCGCPSADDPAKAAFALLTDPTGLLGLERFAQGTPEFPDRSATILCALPALEGGSVLSLSGPGIAGSRSFAPAGLPEGFTLLWAANNARYPLGVDLVLAAGDALAALPRTTRLEH